MQISDCRLDDPFQIEEIHGLGRRKASGGIAPKFGAARPAQDEREAAWLRTPCLVLRPTTEWVEAVEESSGRMVVVGLDRERAVAELRRLAPAAEAADIARDRAATLDLRPAGAADAIVAALEAGTGAPAGDPP